MKTEVLNEYVFAEIVMKSAIAIRNRRVNALEDAGEITPEQRGTLPQTAADVRPALIAIQHNKKVVFDILSELQSEPSDSPPSL